MQTLFHISGPLETPQSVFSPKVISGDRLATQGLTAPPGVVSRKPFLGKSHLLLLRSCSPHAPFRCPCPMPVPSLLSPSPPAHQAGPAWAPTHPHSPSPFRALPCPAVGLGEAQWKAHGHLSSGGGTGGSYKYLQLLLLSSYYSFFFNTQKQNYFLYLTKLVKLS